jgi:hypothetical protein
MGFLVWIAIIVVFLAIVGLGWNTFFEGVKKGADRVGIGPIIQNVTNSATEIAKNVSRDSRWISSNVGALSLAALLLEGSPRLIFFQFSIRSFITQNNLVAL